jgi:hypothetical protein
MSEMIVRLNEDRVKIKGCEYVRDLIRCKDCKYWEKHETWSACTYWTGDPYDQAAAEAEDFCSFAEPNVIERNDG